METKKLSLMKVKQGNGGTTCRVTIPSSMLHKLGGLETRFVEVGIVDDGILVKGVARNTPTEEKPQENEKPQETQEVVNDTPVEEKPQETPIDEPTEAIVEEPKPTKEPETLVDEPIEIDDVEFQPANKVEVSHKVETKEGELDTLVKLD